jgi:hypothetical protein
MGRGGHFSLTVDSCEE